MLLVEELEELCKSQYKTDEHIKNENISFDYVEQRDNFLVASKVEEKVVENNNVTPHKESSALYFIVPCEFGKPSSETLLVEIKANEAYHWDVSKREGKAIENTILTIRNKDERIAYIRAGKYYNVADKEQLALLISNSDKKIYSSQETHNERDYSNEPTFLRKKISDFLLQKLEISLSYPDREKKSNEEDLRTNLDRISMVFASFIGSEEDLIMEKARINAEKFNKDINKIRSDIRRRLANLPLKGGIKKDLNLLKAREERAAEERQKTASLPNRLESRDI